MKRIVIASAVLALSIVPALSGCATQEGYPANSEGYTYGEAPENPAEGEEFPDLVAVLSDQGDLGYVFWEETSAVPETPKDAAAVNEEMDGKVLDVYDAETMEVIGTFTLGDRDV